MTGRQLAKRTPVGEIDHQLDIGPTVVALDAPLVEVAHLAIAHPRTRILAVTDASGRLVGLLPVLRVVEEIVAQASPEVLMAEVTDLEMAARFGREVRARVAGDLMGPARFLRPESTVGEAFRMMHEHRLSGLPIVDGAGQVMGYIDLLELALRYLDEASIGSADGPPTSQDTTEAAAKNLGGTGSDDP
jgi:CBS domain-containing protein